MHARAEAQVERTWTFLTNHAHVLLVVAEDSEVRLRDIADRVGVTERAVQGILTDLEECGYLVRERVGRRNRYRLVRGGRFRHPLESSRRVDDLLRIFR
jgi:DNA-binding MarR family transcriptional regulator